MMMERLRIWIASFLGLQSLHDKIEDIEKTRDSQHVAVLDLLSEHQTVLSGILEKLDAYPPLSMGFLMAWEAVSYAADKFDKDKQQHGIHDRTAEVVKWGERYMTQHRWQAPPQESLIFILRIRDQLESLKKAG